jgi:DNA-binding NarL/FixJ family response regulator
MTIRVAVADDNLLVREGIIHVLEHVPEIEVVSTSADLDELLAAIEEEDPDVVLTDIRMPPTNRIEGISVANQLHGSHPGTAVIVLSQYADPQYALSLLEQGSARRGYLLKDRLGDRGELVNAIEQVAGGGSVIDPEVVERLVSARKNDKASPLNRLTPREHEVLAEVASGKSNAAIAETLVISKRGVERHVGAIFAKLDLPQEAEASRRVKATLLFLANQGGASAEENLDFGEPSE